MKESVKDYFLERAQKDFASYEEAFHRAARGSSLMNGGAAIAMLTFLGRIITASSFKINIPIKEIVDGCAVSLCFFSIGVLLSVVSSFILSLSKRHWASLNLKRGGVLHPNEEPKEPLMYIKPKMAEWGSNIASFFIILSFIAFVIGSLVVYLLFVS